MSEPTHAHILSGLEEVKNAVKDLASKVEAQGTQIAETRDIVQAWGAVKTGGRFAVGLGKFVTALAAIYLFGKHVLGAMVMGAIR